MWSQFGTKCKQCGFVKVTTLMMPSEKVIGKAFAFKCSGCGISYKFNATRDNVVNCDPTVPYWESSIKKILLSAS